MLTGSLENAGMISCAKRRRLSREPPKLMITYSTPARRKASSLPMILVWRADQAVRLRFLGRMTIGQDMRSAGTVWSSMNRHFDLLSRPFSNG
jgi:hypothetical protein